VKLIEQVITQLSRLPGLGRKSASRIAYYLMQADFSSVQYLVKAIIALKKNLKSCSICGNYSEFDPCDICTDQQRDRSIICVVEQPKDVLTIESTNDFNGIYHVLGGVISPINGIGPQDLRIDQLVKRVEIRQIQEIILATNPNLEGDTTAMYLSQILHESDVIISRLALGLPVGGDLEYADKLTLSRAFKGRNSL